MAICVKNGEGVRQCRFMSPKLIVVKDSWLTEVLIMESSGTLKTESELDTS